MDLTVSDLIRDGQENYDRQLRGFSDRELFCQLSSLRRAALAWYPIAADAAVLEAGCGCGAMTGLLCERAGHVDAVDQNAQYAGLTRRRCSRRHNLTVHTADLREFEPQRQYDLIAGIGLLTQYEGDITQLLSRFKGWLKPGGVILLGFRTPFAGRTKRTKTLCTREQIEKCAAGAGLSEIRWFYPVPDFQFTQAVYSDVFRPQEELAGRILTDSGQETVLPENVEEARFLLAEIRCGKAPEENGKDPDAAGDKGVIAGAVLSADREAEHAFSTETYARADACAWVVKRALFPEGAKGLKALEQNMLALSEAGLQTVPVSRDSDSPDTAVRMPYMTDRSFTDVIRDALRADPEKVPALFEQLYQDVLRSSPHAGGTKEDPVLARAYIDMIPDNAFYRDGKIIWFDQEFTADRCPASFVMYRALRYTWLHISGAQDILPIERLTEHFHLADKWEEYTRREDEFTEKVRRRADFPQLYHWAWGRKLYHTGLVMGAFDLLHEGHRRLFERAKSRCDILRVGVLSDALIRKYKNIDPAEPQQERLRKVQGEDCVDEAYLVEGEYVSKVQEWHRKPYDCFFSGDDYADNEYWKKEAGELIQLGSQMEFFPYTESVSSTMLRRRRRLYSMRGWHIRVESSRAAACPERIPSDPGCEVSVKIIHLGADRGGIRSIRPEHDPHMYARLCSPFPEEPEPYIIVGFCRDEKGNLWAGQYSQAYIRDPAILTGGLRFEFEVPEALALQRPRIRLFMDEEKVFDERFEKPGRYTRLLDARPVGDELCAYMDETRRLQRILYGEVMRLCEKYHISYYLICGGLIGLVRDGDLLPWDDDLDLAVSRRGFEKLKRAAAREWADGERFLWLSPEDYGGDVFFDFMTRAVYLAERAPGDAFSRIEGCGRRDIHYRQTLDIYILENAAGGRIRHFMQTRRLQLLYALCMGRRPAFDAMDNINHGRLTLLTSRLLAAAGRRIPLRRLLGAARRTALRYARSKSSAYFLSNGYYRTIPLRFDKKWFSEGRTFAADRGQMSMKMPSDPHAYLTAMYGDYTNYPWPWHRNPSHKKQEM